MLSPKIALCVIGGLLTAIACADPACADHGIQDQWRYVLRKPQAGWQKTNFDDSAWKSGSGGFGMHDTPGARVGTTWSTNNIWLRKAFSLTQVPQKPALLIHHDEDVQVFINGTQVAGFRGWTTEYKVLPLADGTQSVLQTGPNVMAVHCRQTSGGQFIDVHLVDADHVPELPAAKRATTPFESKLITTWGADVTPDNAWTEYPRPQMVRTDWQNLNGLWDYAITARQQTQPPTKFAGTILVPFALEAKLGRVQRLLQPFETLWYRRRFSVPSGDRDTLLNFEAVDYRCTVIVNGQSVGTHTGGHTPFSIDITNAVQAGENELVVRVDDDTEAWQLRGKQSLNPHGIWYTQVSGIWQTVWLEQVPRTRLDDLVITTDAAQGSITVRPVIRGSANVAGIVVEVREGDQLVQTAQGSDEVTVRLPDPKLWSPDSPFLYDLDVSLTDNSGAPLDRVTSYAGIRSVGKVQDADGHWRMTLNGQPVFHWGPLDQGWWPDGLLTPPSDDAMLFDIEYLKAAGFNMIRKHIKVEPRRYYYHCDRLGMMVWQDQVSAGHNPRWTRLAPNPEDAAWPDDQHAQYLLEFERMIQTLHNHPSIVMWVPFNEAWGQHRTLEVGKWVVQRDPSRLSNVASGGNFQPVGDVVDHHSYPDPDFPFDRNRFQHFIKVVGEFGGHGLPMKGHLWDPDRRNWGYGGLPETRQEFQQRYVTSLKLLNDLRSRGIAAGVYTQTTDVEEEINGLMTYDRRVIKIPAKELAELHQILFQPVSQ